MHIKKLDHVSSKEWPYHALENNYFKIMEVVDARLGMCWLYHVNYNTKVLRCVDSGNTYELKTESIGQILDDVEECYPNDTHTS